ncbi:MAG: biosynthetic-type acetolactate synthase large subunit, partial [Oligoflexia bacterium]|nr:biosynthetic-type acetolactate synthase large subunit [Oligoflexia bacterium]
QIILECLKEHNVTNIFGFPGGAVIPLYDALYDNRNHFKHTLSAHEQGAVHAADGYARSTGKTGVCFVTSGPGATNTVTGIATAYIDSVPLVIITGQVPCALLGKNSFQEVDITGITSPITKKNYLVKDAGKLASIVDEALFIASDGRPGPVLIDVPKDIFTMQADYVKREINNRKRTDHKNVSDHTIRELSSIINKSARPIIFAGGGIKIAGAEDELVTLAEKAGIPVTNSLMGLGTFPRDNFLSMGLLGMHGSKAANLAVTNCDLFIALGTRFSDRVTGKTDMFAAGAEIIHIDIDDREIGKNKNVHFSIQGDVKHILSRLIENITPNNRKDWIDMITAWDAAHPENTNEMNPRNIICAANDIFSDNTIITTDVGQHQMWTAQYWKFKKARSFLTSGGMGTMGYGLGAAIGAQTANPDKRVVAITGDGSFRMNCNELATVSRYGLPITIILFNNGALGMVRQWQRLFQSERYSETDITNNVDYVGLAKAYGINGFKVDNINSLNSALNKARDSRTATLIECIIDKDEGVYPIVPPGMPIDNLILNQSGM